MTVLKVAADIYLGKLIGFAKQPRDPEQRRHVMKSYLRQLGLKSIYEAVSTSKNIRASTNLMLSASKLGISPESQSAGLIKKIAVKASIEYCNLIEDSHLLFNEIFTFLESENLLELYYEALVNLVFTSKTKRSVKFGQPA